MTREPKHVVSKEELIKWYLKSLPTPEETLPWERLSRWQQMFVSSIRKQFTERGTLSERQFTVLQDLYERDL